MNRSLNGKELSITEDRFLWFGYNEKLVVPNAKEVAARVRTDQSVLVKLDGSYLSL